MNLLVAFSMAWGNAAARPELIAHRGESHDAPENTLAAFRLAWDRNVPAIELDVHLTRDGRLVCLHDADTKRIAGVSRVVQDTALAELRTLDVGSWKDPRWKGERIPTLEEVLATIPDAGRCLIEVKVGPEAVPALSRAIRDAGKRPAQLAIISFNAETLVEVRRQLPELETYLVASFRRDQARGAWQPTIEALIQQAQSLGVRGLNLAHAGPLDRDAVQRIQAAGLKLFAWTIDDVRRAQALADWGADGITSNRAAFLRQHLFPADREAE